jgi:tripartite-type tricarboxylate transporter receptor subunit TctC
MSDLIELGEPDSLKGTFVDQLRKKDAEIERLKADCEMKDKRIDWTVSDNVKKALEIERLEAALREIANAANYTAPEDIEARLQNEVKVYAIARAALENDSG